MSALYFQILMSVAAFIFAVFMALYGRRILEEVRSLRISFTKSQIVAEKRLTRLEVKVDQLEKEG